MSWNSLRKVKWFFDTDTATLFSSNVVEYSNISSNISTSSGGTMPFKPRCNWAYASVTFENEKEDFPILFQNQNPSSNVTGFKTKKMRAIFWITIQYGMILSLNIQNVKYICIHISVYYLRNILVVTYVNVGENEGFLPFARTWFRGGCGENFVGIAATVVWVALTDRGTRHRGLDGGPCGRHERLLFGIEQCSGASTRWACV